MHELPVTENILRIVLRHAEEAKADRVLSVSLRVGELSDIIDEWLQRYFDYLSRGTPAEGAQLKIEKVPVVFCCESCGASFHVNIREIEKAICSICGGDRASLVSGREFFVKAIEVI